MDGPHTYAGVKKCRVLSHSLKYLASLKPTVASRISQITMLPSRSIFTGSP
jgi:hypothetical protein